MNVWVQATQSFEHNGKRSSGSRFQIEGRTAEQLAARGLVRVLGEKNPRKPDGTEPASSASQAGQASPQATSKQSDNGVKKKSTKKTKKTKKASRKRAKS